MIINHNMSAINANRVLKFKHWDTQASMEKLASGLRINRSGDDASGLAVSEKMRTQIQGLRQAERNTEDGMSFIQASEGYLAQTTWTPGGNLATNVYEVVEDCYFVLGDNRNSSTDSRDFGAVPRRWILGKAASFGSAQYKY